jgi:hypothetical protein
MVVNDEFYTADRVFTALHHPELLHALCDASRTGAEG